MKLTPRQIGSLEEASRAGVLHLEAARNAAADLGCSLMEVERAALSRGIWPLRLHRHEGLLSPDEQLRLLSSRVVVAGCGGIGGNAAVFLARLGIGYMVLIDPDRFQESNMNRQSFSSVRTIGRYKAEVLAEGLSGINPAADFVPVTRRLEESASCFRGADLCLDCLDSISSRKALSEICRKLEIPLIFGAVSGLCAQVAVETVGQKIFQSLYPGGSRHERDRDRPEAVFSFTAGAAAVLQAAVAMKLLTRGISRGESTGMFLDLEVPELEIIMFP